MGLKRNPIALHLPGGAPGMIVFSEHVIVSMTNNVWFPDPNPTLVVLREATDALKTAAAAAVGLGEGTVAARDVEQKKLEDLLIAEKAYVQGIINKNPYDALAIAKSAGMTLRVHTPFHKPPLAARMGLVPNEILVIAKAVGRGAAYEWQYSIDAGQAWITIALTNEARVTLSGATPGAMYLFRFRTTARNKTTDWSSTISFVAR